MYRLLKRKQKGDGRHLKPTGKQKVRAPVTHRAVQRETRTIPIVFAAASDPVGSGIVARLDRPSENITGFAIFESSLGGKWLQLLSEIAPWLKRRTGHGHSDRSVANDPTRKWRVRDSPLRGGLTGARGNQRRGRR